VVAERSLFGFLRVRKRNSGAGDDEISKSENLKTNIFEELGKITVEIVS
jgi:hypothetical protein